MLRSAAEKGNWLYLKNIHLVISFLPTLEKELRTLNLHPDFRLWLTSEAHPQFPAVLLESCFKVTYEAPPGIKKNVESIFKSWNSAFF
jgi:dynein heavy chain 2